MLLRIIIVICNIIKSFLSSKNIKKIIGVLLTIVSSFTIICLVYGTVLSYIENHSSEKVFRKYKITRKENKID